MNLKHVFEQKSNRGPFLSRFYVVNDDDGILGKSWIRGMPGLLKRFNITGKSFPPLTRQWTIHVGVD